MAKVRRAAKRGKRAARPRAPVRTNLLQSPEPDLHPALPADEEGRICLPESKEWVDYESYRKMHPMDPRAFDPNTREWITDRELTRRYPDLPALLEEARQREKIGPPPSSYRDLQEMGMRSSNALREHIATAPICLTWQEHYKRWCDGDPSVVDHNEHGERIPRPFIVNVAQSWSDLGADFHTRARAFARFVEPGGPSWHAEVAALLRAAFFFHYVREFETKVRPPFKGAVIEATQRFAREAQRYITTLAQTEDARIDVWESGGLMAGLWDLWDRPSLARKLLEAVAAVRHEEKNEQEIAFDLVGDVQRRVAHRLTLDEQSAAVSKLAAWLTLHGDGASDEKVARAALRYIGLDPKVIFGAIRRKDQRVKAALREDATETPKKG